MAWTALCPSEALGLGQHRRIDAGGQAILLARLEDGLHAVHDICLHRGASLAAGPLDGEVITCHLHFWGFNVRTGACTQVPTAVLRVFALKEEDGMVYADL